MTTTVSIRELKDKLSSYVRRIRAGEEVVLTSRKREVVRMLPIAEPGEGALATLPLVSWNGQKPRGGRNRPRIEGRTAADIVLGDRR